MSVMSKPLIHCSSNVDTYWCTECVTKQAPAVLEYYKPFYRFKNKIIKKNIYIQFPPQNVQDQRHMSGSVGDITSG